MDQDSELLYSFVNKKHACEI